MTLTGVPRATVPARQAHRRARFLLVGVASGPVLALLALAVAAGGGSRPPAMAGQQGHDRAFAEVAAEDFLAGRPTVLPYVQGLDPVLGRGTTQSETGGSDPASGGGAPVAIPFRSLAWRSASEGRAGGQSYELDTFVVATASALWHLTIQVIDAPAGPVIGADPSLAPDPTAPAGTEGALGYSGLAGAGQPELGPGAQRQVQAWAQAYVEGDGATLYRLSGDTGGHTYPSLQGWALDRASVAGSVVKADAALAQVQVVMHEVADPALSVTSSYDLLLDHLGQALPFVQAWGAAGAGPTLVPFANAVRP